MERATGPCPAKPDSRTLAGQPWYAMEGARALEALDGREGGLSAAEAAARLAHFGPNVLPRAERTSVLTLYLRQFKNPLVYLLLAATVVSLGVGELADAFFIFVVLQLNAAIGAFQEWKARENAAALDALIGATVTVLRDGRPMQIDAVGLVPGDLVQLQSGTQVSADLRLLSERELTVDEALLTGESTPVTKDAAPLDAPTSSLELPLAERRNMLHAGTVLLQGRATGLVTATGGRTEIGRVAEALAKGSPVAPPLVRNLERFSRIIGIATVVLIALLASIQMLQGVPLVTVFLVAVALAVAAIPEGLPVAITVALAIATNRMAARKVIVRALPAVEGLGACTHIASDKTGTLTCNELTIKSVRLFGTGAPDAPVLIGGEGFAPHGEATLADRPLTPDELDALRRLAETGALCNEASVRFTEAGAERLGDTVDVAFLVMARKLGLDHGRLCSERPQVGVIPYEPQRRYAASFTAAPGPELGSTAMAHVKGAAEVVLPLCEGVEPGGVLAEADRMAAAGFRVLAVARGPVGPEQTRKAELEAPYGLELLGLVGLIDPVRPEVPAAVDLCRRAGIGVSMVTGDHPETALAIARQLKIAESPAEVVTGAALAAAREDRDAFDRLVRRGSVFARVEPLQKLAIVQAMQRNGEVVAVTGDGVNDAAALGAANIGVAMGLGGTDITRGAADLILADDNFASIVAGVEEGRIAYANVRKLIFLLIATGLGEIVLFFLAIVTGHPVPLTAVQLLWLNLVTNGIQHVALAFERGEPGILDRKPRPPKQSLFDGPMVAQVLAAGVFMGAMAFLFYIWCLAQGMDQATARNLLLLLMVLFENAHALNARSESRSVFQVPFSANWFLILAVLGAHGLHIVAMYLPGLNKLLDMQPVAFTDWAMVAAVAMSLIVVVELYKRTVAPRLRRRHGSMAA